MVLHLYTLCCANFFSFAKGRVNFPDSADDPVGSAVPPPPPPTPAQVRLVNRPAGLQQGQSAGVFGDQLILGPSPPPYRLGNSCMYSGEKSRTKMSSLLIYKSFEFSKLLPHLC
jgi:hypothetical protein